MHYGEGSSNHHISRVTPCRNGKSTNPMVEKSKTMVSGKIGNKILVFPWKIVLISTLKLFKSDTHSMDSMNVLHRLLETPSLPLN